MAEMLEYKTEFGSYWVTAEDHRLMCDDMTLYGTIAVKTQVDGDRVIGRRVDPSKLPMSMLEQ